MKRPFILIFGVLCIEAFGQYPVKPQPATPQASTFSPMGENGHYRFTLTPARPVQPSTSYVPPMGMTGDAIKEQVNRNASHGGIPILHPNATQKERQQASEAYIRQRMANDPMYQYPNTANGFTQTHLSPSQQQIINLLNEVHASESPRRSSASYYQSSEFTALTKPYTDALQELKMQLAGLRPLSVADAYFAVENAFGNAYLSKNEYDRTIEESVVFIRRWLSQHGYNLQDNEALHIGLQRFLSDTLTIRLPASADRPGASTLKTHLPFFYDYEDYTGTKDYRNYFLTKCLATGSGQCNSLPTVYNALAQKLGAVSYLSFAPQHSLIKYPGKDGRLHNYEATTNWKISDKWYRDNLFVKQEALRNHMYLDTLNYTQMVANAVIDLATGYIQKHGAADGRFVDECLNLAAPYFPKRNNIYLYFVRSLKLAYLLERELHTNGIEDVKDIERFPHLKSLYEALEENERLITGKGYQGMPPELYNQMMEEHQYKNRQQSAKSINGKQKRNLFITQPR